ncbi:glycine betaine ABC transporter substrate-binding protein [Lederbergia galactosidilytica]|uniref:Glycine/betaine ABC transporter substrate-binding protein n=1 Tax=Lederbergia galactosidilytica TaxID=217031 RepID=A0A177ZU09_9BACI|nr:glycine betaine ABC transporter substrate-binding protein [Lederbergia galactosidilytica]KRG14402.1 glycine/betaine ABC transporter substrate-binding protein [Virgibacillus soli]MBP1916730.1 glycine betaine/proline transport system substrate-binding protein [Lederbergia galactosidilytica]OAK70979.1 glycine/betaine ABC transporter substrate-binding protein [Lederbergia galactosidilytica]
MKKRFYLIGLVALSLSMLLAACGNDSNDESTNDNGSSGEKTSGGVELGQKDLTLPYVAWARETPVSYLLAAVLEDVGYNVDVKQVEAGPMWSSVADGSADFMASAWLPATHASYWEQYEDDLVKVNQVLDKAPLALAVPSYMEDVNSIEDLKDNEELGKSVDWKITGIDAGAGIMQNTETAMEEYGLDNWNLVTSSEAAMIAELRSAYDKEEPIVVPLWKPHWVFGVMDMKMLEDPKEVYGGDGDQIYIVARKGLEEDAPAAYKVLEQYTEDYEMVEELMPPVFDEDKDPADVAQQFMEDHPDLVEQWTEGVK